MIAAGLMSGTSADGIDAALVDIVPRGAGYAVEVRRFVTVAYEPALRARLLAAMAPAVPDVREIVELDALTGAAFGAAAVRIAQGAALDFVASHGQTMYHDGARARSLQIGNAFAIRECTGASVIYDFRAADCAAGGHGAPLVPYVDALLFADAAQDRVMLNIGGIANLTVLPRGARSADVVAYDTGPGNMVIDAWVSDRTAQAERFDRGGSYARRGTPDAALLAVLLSDPYFEMSAPKSTGRERFGHAFLEKHRGALAALGFEDACATLTALTAHSITAAIRRDAPPGARVIVSGGGVHNRALMGMLAALLPGYALEPSHERVAPDAKEAVAFAVLGYETLRGRPAGMPRVTGARHASVLGAIAPLHLDVLLAKIAAELARNAGA